MKQEHSQPSIELPLWEQLFQHAGWGIAMVDPDTHRLRAVNAAFAAMHGYDPDELVGRPLTDVFAPESLGEFAAHTAAVHAKGRHQYESEHLRKDGTSFPCLTDTMAFKDKNGKVVYRAANFQDITERKRHEANLKAAITARDEFLSIASHEFRTPLTTLILQLENLQRALLRATSEESAKLLKKVESAVRQTERLTNLIDGFLDVSRIGAGKLRMDPSDFDAVDLIRSLAARFEREAGRSECELVLSLPPMMPVHWDRERIDQALTHLVANAIKYGPGKPIELRLDSDGLFAKIVVRDHGIGINTEDLNRIFEPFERAVPSQHYGGLGIGLFVTRQIAEAHGGSIDVESRVGDGTVFLVRLPKQVPEGLQASE